MSLPAAEPQEAVLLAGGSSRRMGREKALLVLAGETLLERSAAALLKAGFGHLLVSVPQAGPSPALAEEISRLRDRGFPLEAVRDLRPGPQGPLGGVEAALGALVGPAALFAAADLPHLDPPLLAMFRERALAGGFAGVVPRWRRGLEPALAVYGRKLLPEVRRLLEAGGPLQALAEAPEVAWLDLEAGLEPRVAGPCLLLEWEGDPARLFRNLNRPEDYRRALEEIEGRGGTGGRPAPE